MDHGECRFKRRVQSLDGGIPFLLSPVADDSLRVLDVHIAELIVPVAVDDVAGLGKLSVSQGHVDVPSCSVHLVQNPSLSQCLASSGSILGGHEVLREAAQDVLGRLELCHVRSPIVFKVRIWTYDLVAELAEAVDAAKWSVAPHMGQEQDDLHLDVEVDIATSGGGVDHSEPKSIRTTLRNAIREGSLLVLGGLLYLTRVEVAKLEL